MPQKLTDEQLAEKQFKKYYSEKIKEVMDLIPQQNVFCQDLSFRDTEMGVFLPANKWIIGDYALKSDLYMLCSIEEDDIEKPMFGLTETDYNRVVSACEQRHAEILKQHHIKRK